MAQFAVNTHRFDPYKNFKFRVKWDGRYVAGVSKVSALKRCTEVIEHREGGDPSSSRKMPGTQQIRGDHAGTRRDPRCGVRAVGQQGVELWLRARRGSLAQGFPQRRDPRDVQRGRASWCWHTRSTAAGFRNTRRCRTWTPMPTRSRSSRSSSKTKVGNAITKSQEPTEPSFTEP